MLGEFAASYRVLRAGSPEGPFEVIGETIFARFTDTLLGDLWQPLCYAVQSYNGDGNLSPLSTPLCAAFQPYGIHLPILRLGP
jgi:hypothetical protein